MREAAEWYHNLVAALANFALVIISANHAAAGSLRRAAVVRP